MGILLWLLFGGLIGWFASLLTSDDGRMGVIANIIVGLVGSVIGGLIAESLGYGGVTIFTWSGSLFALLGAVILLTVINLLNRRR